MDLGHMTLTIFLYVLAVMRVTRLINGDTILDRIRIIPAQRAHTAREKSLRARHRGDTDTEKLFGARARRWSTLLYFIECPWCVSMWLAFGTAWLPLFHADNHAVQYIGIALAASHLVGVFAFAADTEEVEVEESSR